MKLTVAICACLTGAVTVNGAEARYLLVPLEIPFNTNYYSTEGWAINDDGLVAGVIVRQPWAAYPSGSMRGLFVHSKQGGFQDVGDYGGLFTQPSRINSSGQVSVIAYGGGFATNDVWTNVHKAALFSLGTGFVDLGGFGGPMISAAGIDSQGRVVGRAQTPDRIDHAFLYDPATGMVDLGTFGGISAGVIDINDEGWLSGVVRFTNGLYSFLFHQDHGLTVFGLGRAFRVNERRTVLCIDANQEPFINKANGQTVRIHGAGGISPDPTGDLNDWNVVVGSGILNESSGVGYIWTEAEGITDLNGMIATNSGWRIIDAYSVNNRGQIACAGIYESRRQAIRLDPIAPTLAVQLLGTNLVLSWTSPWPVPTPLETSTNLSSSLWSLVSTGMANVLTLPASDRSRFFRLNLDALRGLCCVPQ